MPEIAGNSLVPSKLHSDNGTLVSRIVILAVSIILGLFFSLAAGYLESDTVECPIDACFFLRFILFTVSFTVLFCFATWVFRANAANRHDDPLPFIGFFFSDNVSFIHQVMRLTIVTALLWLPYLALMYPGNLSNDTTGQLAMYFAIFDSSYDIPLSNHHPIFDTLVFGFIMQCSYALFHDYQLALFSLLIVQLIAIAASVSYAIMVFQKRIGCSERSVAIAWSFFALFPLFPIIGSSLSKDTFFIWVYVLFFSQLAETILSGLQLDARKLASLALLGVLMSLTKQLGVYIFVGAMLVCFLCAKTGWNNRVKLLLPVLATIVLSFGVMPSLQNSFGVTPSGKQEMLSVPLQQSALTYIRHKDNMSEEEILILDEAFAPKLDQVDGVFKPQNADPIKGFGQYGRTFDGYIPLWLEQMRSYPKDYLDAWLALESPLFSAAKIAPLFSTPQHSWDPGYFDASFYEKPTLTAEISSAMYSCYNQVKQIPILSILFMQTTYVVIIPAIYLVALFTKKPVSRRNAIIVLSPLFFVLLGLFVSPTVRECAETMRYILPFIYSAPLLITFCFNLEVLFRNR